MLSCERYLGGAAETPSATEQHSTCRSCLQSQEVLDSEVSICSLQPGSSQTRPVGVSSLHTKMGPPGLLRAQCLAPHAINAPLEIFHGTNNLKPVVSYGCGRVSFRVMGRILAQGEEAIEGSCRQSETTAQEQEACCSSQ